MKKYAIILTIIICTLQPIKAFEGKDLLTYKNGTIAGCTTGIIAGLTSFFHLYKIKTYKNSLNKIDLTDEEKAIINEEISHHKKNATIWGIISSCAFAGGGLSYYMDPKEEIDPEIARIEAERIAAEQRSAERKIFLTTHIQRLLENDTIREEVLQKTFQIATAQYATEHNINPPTIGNIKKHFTQNTPKGLLSNLQLFLLGQSFNINYVHMASLGSTQDRRDSMRERNTTITQIQQFLTGTESLNDPAATNFFGEEANLDDKEAILLFSDKIKTDYFNQPFGFSRNAEDEE